MPPKKLILTKHHHGRHAKKQLRGKIMCYNECGTELHIGDEVVAKAGGRAKSKLYCVKCAKRLNLI